MWVVSQWSDSEPVEDEIVRELQSWQGETYALCNKLIEGVATTQETDASGYRVL